MSQKVFKYFFLLSPLNHAFKGEKTLLLLSSSTSSAGFMPVSQLFSSAPLPVALVACVSFSFLEIVRI